MKASFSVSLSPASDFGKLIQAGYYYHVDSRFNYLGFHYDFQQVSEPIKEKIYIFSFEGNIHTYDVKSKMAELEMQPANLHHLLALGAQNKLAQRSCIERSQYDLVFLGSSDVWDLLEVHPIMGMYAQYRFLSIGSEGMGSWKSGYKFAAVKSKTAHS